MQEQQKQYVETTKLFNIFGQEITIEKTSDLVGFHEIPSHRDTKYTVVCVEHSTYMYGPTKKFLKTVETTEWCEDCRFEQKKLIALS